MARKTRHDRYSEYLAAVAKVKGPAPTNPFKWLRLNANLTIQDLCDATHVSKQAVIRLEQGTYAEPIDRIVSFWINRHYGTFEETTYPDLVNSYEHYQQTIRKRHARPFGKMPLLSDFQRRLDRHPFSYLRSMWTNPETKQIIGSMSVTECAKVMCVPQSVLDHWNNKIVRQQTVPKPFIDALRQAGYSADDIKTLERAYSDHRRFMLNGITPDEWDRANQETLKEIQRNMTKSGASAYGYGVTING